MTIGTSQVAQMVKNLPAIEEIMVRSWVKKVFWRREWVPTPVGNSCLENFVGRGALQIFYQSSWWSRKMCADFFPMRTPKLQGQQWPNVGTGALPGMLA